MKKIILAVILSLFIGSMCFAAGIQDKLTSVLAKKGAGAAANPCPSGTYEFGYNGDHTSGATYACYESGTANEAASANTADYVGTDYVSFNDANKNLTWTITGDISADIDSLGSLFVSVYVPTTWAAGALVELNYSSTEQIHMSAQATSGRIDCKHEGGAYANTVLVTGLSEATWYRCGYTWDAANNVHAMDCVASGSVTWDSNGGNPDDQDYEDIDGFDDTGAVDPTVFVLGEASTSLNPTTALRVKDAYLVPGYKATDPGSL